MTDRNNFGSLTALCLSMSLLACPGIVRATPTAPSGGASIQNNTPARAFVDTVEKQKIWVFPPQQGRYSGRQFSNATSQSSCESLETVLKAAKTETDIVEILTRKQKALAESMDALNDGDIDKKLQTTKRIRELKLLIQDELTDLNKLLISQGGMYGGSLTLSYTNALEANIASIRASNPTFSVVTRGDTSNVRLYFSIPGSSVQGVPLELMPIIMDYSVLGLKSQQLATTTAAIADKMDVSVSLTRWGACLMAYPQKFGTLADPKFPMMAVFEYPYAFKTNVKAHYNLKSIYSYLREQGTEGGLFTSSSWARTVESNWGSSAFRIDWTSNDPNSQITVAQRLEIEKTIKSDLLANLDTLIRISGGLSAASAVNPGPHGATVVADGLMKSCGGNGYCAAASVALIALDSIFGSSSMSTSIEQKLDVAATYEMNSTQARLVPATIVFGID